MNEGVCGKCVLGNQSPDNNLEVSHDPEGSALWPLSAGFKGALQVQMEGCVSQLHAARPENATPQAQLGCRQPIVSPLPAGSLSGTAPSRTDRR